MKALQILIVTALAALGLSLSACTGEPKTAAETTPTRLESYKILIRYAKMDEDKMIYLDISEKEAEQLGVPSEHYHDGLFDIQCTNEAIRQMKDNGESVEHLKLPEYSTNMHLYPKVYENLPGGRITTAGNGPDDEVYAFFFAPEKMQGVRFECKCNAALFCDYKCMTYSFGTSHLGRDVGSCFTYTNIGVPLAASNIQASISFACTDPNGAQCTYYGY